MMTKRTRKSESVEAKATVQSVAMVLAVSSFMALSIVIADDQADRGAAPNSGNSSIPPRYAVIDLGANTNPKKITGSGYVLMTTGASYYRWFNGTPTQLQSSSNTPTDITEDGTIAGGSFDQSTNLDVAQWAPNSSTETEITTPYTPAPTRSFPILISPDHLIWSAQGGDISSLGSPGNAGGFVDGFKNSTRLGTTQESTNPISYTGFSLYPLAVNNSDHVIGTKVQFIAPSPSNPRPAPQSLEICLDTVDQVLTFQAKALNNASTPMVVGVNTNTSEAVWWNGSTTHSLGGGGAVGVNAASNTVNGTAGPATQIIGYDSSSHGVLWEMNPTNNSVFGPPLHLDDLVSTNSGWSGVGASFINDSGAIVGTATYTPTGTGDPIAAGLHGVMLLPLQLKLLNGSTADFDGSVPTSWIPSPEFPYHDDAVSFTGVTNLGPFVVTALNGQGTLPTSGYYYALMVAAQAPANISGIQYQWKRYWKGRQWYLIYNSSTGDWDVSNRSSWGTLSSQTATNGKDDTGPPSDSIPSTTKHEFYAADSPSFGYGHDANDSQCHNGDYMDEEETFTYKVQYSFDGTNWHDGASLVFHHQITVQFKQNYTGNLSNDLNVQTNAISSGDNDPTMTPTKAAFVTGSAHVNLGSNVNITGF